MEDSKDTVFVQNIGRQAEGEEFIKLFNKIGRIKTNRHTGERLAVMVPNNGTKVGIVTFEDETKAQDAVRLLNGLSLGESKIKVLTAQEMFKTLGIGQVDKDDEHHNTAWRFWSQQYSFHRGNRQEGHHPQGGEGGKGGDGLFGLFRGQDGQPGESGPYGKGGEGGKGGCSVS